MPHSPLHKLRDAPGSPTRDLESLVQRVSPGINTVLRVGNGDVTTQMLGGCFWFEEPHMSPLLRTLPPLLYIAGEQQQGAGWLHTILALVAEEAITEQLGAQTVINYLSSILFVQAVRSYVSQLSETGNWLGALGDPQIGQALALIHQHWEHPWTVEVLAGRVAMSRSTFATRFTLYVGVSPLRYVTRWRMQQAGRLLRNSNMTLAQIATRVGYKSEMAFGRVFKQWMGVAPGRYRHRESYQGRPPDL
ncbi:MAG: helix-turn-helix transcriptional regulator [Fibrella sp.]|nr:helix-turn-helix transcriptional regulator [Armatimonadota bacterium]